MGEERNSMQTFFILGGARAPLFFCAKIGTHFDTTSSNINIYQHKVRVRPPLPAVD